jgi:hypothetical protein
VLGEAQVSTIQILLGAVITLCVDSTRLKFSWLGPEIDGPSQR